MLGVVVRLRLTSRPVAVPVMAKLVIKGSNSKSRLWLGRRMAEKLAAALPGREIRRLLFSSQTTENEPRSPALQPHGRHAPSQQVSDGASRKQHHSGTDTHRETATVI